MKTKQIFFAFLTVVVAIAVSRAEPSASKPDVGKAAGKTVRLLTVGNSFSHNAIHYLRDLATADGNVLVLGEANIGGAAMSVQWTKVEQHEKDPQNPLGFYSKKMGLKEMLASDKWDYVTIQQASIKSHDLSTYRPYASQLRDYIAKYAPQAQLLLHETWAYRQDDPRFAHAKSAPGEPATQEEMHQQLSAAYAAIGAELKARLIPVGDAFHLANTDPKWGFHPDTKFDAKTAAHPALPDQTHSLNVGWSWGKSGKSGFQLRMDGHHANMAGEYLGGCAFYEVLFGRSVVGNAFVPEGIDPDYARFLQETAHKAVENSRMK